MRSAGQLSDFRLAGALEDARTQSDIFSPWIIADRLAFLILLLYFAFWPIWYASEDKLSARFGDVRIEHLFVVVVSFLAIGTVVRGRARTAGFRPMFLLILYGAVTLVWSVNPKEGLLILLNLASVLIFSQILAGSRARQLAAQFSFLLGLVVMTILGTVRAEAPTAVDFRLLFPHGIDSNQFAVQVALAIVILMAMTVVSSEDRKLRIARFWGGMVLCLFLIGVVILSGSRTGLLAAAAGASLILLVRKDTMGRFRTGRLRLAWIAPVALLGVLALQPLMTSGSATLLERYEEGFFKGDLAGRDMVWGAGARYFTSSPKIMLFGGGIGSFDEAVVDYLNRSLYQIAVNMAAANPSRLNPYFAPHNDLLRIGSDLGLVGLALFLLFYFRVGLVCVRKIGADGPASLPLALFATVIVASMAVDMVSFAAYPIALSLVISRLADSPRSTFSPQ